MRTNGGSPQQWGTAGRQGNPSGGSPSVHRFFVWTIVWLATAFSPAALQGLDHASVVEVLRPISPVASYRRPSHLAATHSGVVVGNQCGTLCLVGPNNQVTAEWRLGDSLQGVCGWSKQTVLVCFEDAFEDAHRLLSTDGKSPAPQATKHYWLAAVSLSRQGDVWEARVRRLARLPHAGFKIQRLGARRTVAVACRWARQTMLFALEGETAADLRVRDRSAVTLPFAPHCITWLPAVQRVAVADAFGGRLAFVRLNDGADDGAGVERVLETKFHNMRGMAVNDRGELIVSHQRLDDGWADRDGVHWGILMANRLWGVPGARLAGANDWKAAEGASWFDDLGLVGAAAGDPGPVLASPDGLLAVGLSGIGKVLVASDAYRKQIDVQRQPTALLRRGRELWVANRLSDSVSVIDLDRGAAARTVSLGPPAKATPEHRGERLFYDAALSHDRWMSCHSCHTDGHTSGRLADTLGDGGYGAAKRIPSLLGVSETGPWAWNGETTSLAQQIQKSVRTTMHGRSLSDSQASDIEAFLKSLRPVRPVQRMTGGGKTNAKQASLAARGQRLFRQRGCVQCHAPPLFTTPEQYDVGLRDAAGNRKFNPPSLRGVGLRPRVLHDGSADLETLIRKSKHQLSPPLSQDQADAMLAFLRSL